MPASVQLDGKQIELFVEGESLGRWSLVDVRAERLISSAFSLKLAGEEVTFIADQPTEFAYGGVEAMANVWAKHKSMRLPVRVVANSRSRQGTKSSRIQDLREAIEETLAGNAPTAFEPARPPVRKEASGIASLRDATGREADNEPEDSAEPALPVEDRPPEPEAVTLPPADGSEAEDTKPDIPESHDPVPDSPDTPDAVFAEPETEQVAEPPATDSVFKQSVPWAKSEEAETDDSPEPEAPVPPPAAEAVARGPVAAESVQLGEPDQEDEADDADETLEQAPAQAGSVPWLAPPVADDAPAVAAGTVPEPPPDDPEEVQPAREPEFVVDLGEFDDSDRRASDDDSRSDGSRNEMVAVPAGADDDEDDEDADEPMATTAAKGGIMGAVRSAFVRNRVEHTHDYVEAPGGLGIKRQICAECGHISIGVQ